MYTVASPDPDPNPMGWVQLPNPKSVILCFIPCILGDGVNYLTLRVQFYTNECNEGETLTHNPNECNATLTSGTSPHLYTIKNLVSLPGAKIDNFTHSNSHLFVSSIHPFQWP